jgi:hypothetical protein
MLSDTVIAAVRTGIAAGVALLLTWLLNLGIEVPAGADEMLYVLAFGLFTALYNAVVILLETKVHPYFGVLLGIPKAPTYKRGEVDLAA